LARDFGADFDSGGLRWSVVDDSINETAFQFPIIIIVLIGHNGLDCDQLNNGDWQFERIPVLKIHFIDKILLLIFAIINLELNFHFLS
jgi:uncharacterized integral membrane protein